MKEEHDPSFIADLLVFLRERKAWWLAPVVIMLLAVGSLIILGGSSVLSPFIYSLF